LRSDFEELPVQVEALVRTQETAGENKRDEQSLADLERVHLRDGHCHERTGWAHDQAGDARKTCRNGISEGVTVERRNLAGPEIGERQHDE